MMGPDATVRMAPVSSQPAPGGSRPAAQPPRIAAVPVECDLPVSRTRPPNSCCRLEWKRNPGRSPEACCSRSFCLGSLGIRDIASILRWWICGSAPVNHGSAGDSAQGGLRGADARIPIAPMRSRKPNPSDAPQISLRRLQRQRCDASGKFHPAGCVAANGRARRYRKSSRACSCDSRTALINPLRRKNQRLPRGLPRRICSNRNCAPNWLASRLPIK